MNKFEIEPGIIISKLDIKDGEETVIDLEKAFEILDKLIESEENK